MPPLQTCRSVRSSSCFLLRASCAAELVHPEPSNSFNDRRSHRAVYRHPSVNTPIINAPRDPKSVPNANVLFSLHVPTLGKSQWRKKVEQRPQKAPAATLCDLILMSIESQKQHANVRYSYTSGTCTTGVRYLTRGLSPVQVRIVAGHVAVLR